MWSHAHRSSTQKTATRSLSITRIGRKPSVCSHGMKPIDSPEVLSQMPWSSTIRAGRASVRRLRKAKKPKTTTPRSPAVTKAKAWASRDLDVRPMTSSMRLMSTKPADPTIWKIDRAFLRGRRSAGRFDMAAS